MPPLTSKLLIRDFGAKSVCAKLLLPAIYDAVADKSPEFKRWQKQNPPLKKLKKFIRESYPVKNPQKMVFAVQVYYALVLRSLAKQALGHDISTWDDGYLALNTLDSIPRDCIDERLADYEFDNPPPDVLKTLHHHLFPLKLRHAFGETYTPDWLAEHLLNRLEYDGTTRLIDPACGSGTFLALAVHRMKAQGLGLDEILKTFAGIEISPLAVLSAKVNLILSLRDELYEQPNALNQLPIYHADALLSPPDVGLFDVIVGNPPWINWETMQPDYRAATRPLWEHYGLFLHRNMDTILGSSKKDFAMLMTYQSMDTYLKDGGKLGFIVSESTLKAAGASQGFRRFQIGDTPLCVHHVDDLSYLLPFKEMSTHAVLIVLGKGQANQYPVPVTLWQKTTGGKSLNPAHSLEKINAQTTRTEMTASPIDKQDITSPWIVGTPNVQGAIQKLIGKSSYEAHAGAYSGGANGVYWLEILAQDSDKVTIRNIVSGAKKAVPQVETQLESDLIYPLLRGTDVNRWDAKPSAHILMVQDPIKRHGYDEDWLQAHYPLTHAYLHQFKEILLRRASIKRYFRKSLPFYSMFNISAYSFTPVKVVWHGMGRREMRAAVITTIDGKAILSNQAMHPAISLESETEAHYLAACLNSIPFEFALLSHTQVGGKSFAPPRIVKHLYLPRYDAGNSLHKELAACSRSAHEAVSEGQSVEKIEAQINQLAGDLWGLASTELDDVREGLALLR